MAKSLTKSKKQTKSFGGSAKSAALQKTPKRIATAKRTSQGLARATVLTTGNRNEDLTALLHLAQLRAEKCELKEAREAFEELIIRARERKDLPALMEAVSGCLRLSAEALDHKAIEKWKEELDRLIASHPGKTPPVAWYNLGAVSHHLGQTMKAQAYFLKFIRAVRSSPNPDEFAFVKGWSTLVSILILRGHLRRAQLLAHKLLEHFGEKNYKAINGFLYMNLGTIEEKDGNYVAAREWYQKAHVAFLAEHNWYYHLYVLFQYAQLARRERNYKEAYWYLNLLQQSTKAPEFGVLRSAVESELRELQSDAIDLLIDSRKCFISTREQSEISLGKQYVLLQILEALTRAHEKGGDEKERGLSKADIIRAVWHEDYRPEAHDNKLYYNINRLRRLLEPDVKHPRYLLNWKEGYRLAPGLRVHFVGKTQADGEASAEHASAESHGDDEASAG